MAEDKRTAIIAINIDNGTAIKRIADLSRQIDANKQHVKDLRKAMKELDSTSADYADQVQAITEEIAATNAQSTEYKRTMSDLNRVVANSVRENMNNEGSLKSLRAELSRLTDEYDAMGVAQRKSAEGDELRSRIEDITNEIKGGEEATGRFYRSVGSYEEKIKNALGLNQGFGSSIMGIANGMDMTNGIIPGLKNNIVGLGGAMKTLSANPAFLTIFGVTKIAEGVKFWFDFNKGLSEATRLTQQFTGLSGQELTNYRDEVQSVADVYGKDFNEVMQSANTIAKQFGISYDEAINVIKDGFVAGADVSGQFLDTVKEYPAFFREAGLSASEFVAISTEASKSGVYSDKGVDAIKEATIRLREMTTATDEALAGIGLSGEEIQKAMTDGTMTAFDAIQLVSEKLNELPATSKEVGTAVADIFGGAGEDAGLRYLQTLKDISTDLDEVKSKAGEYATLQEEHLESQIELQKATNQLFGGMGESFDDMILQGKTFINTVLLKLIKGVLKFGGEISGVFSAFLVYVKEAWQATFALGELLYNVVTFQWDKVGNAWDGWLSEISEIPAKVSNAYKEAYEKAKKNIEASENMTVEVAVETKPTVKTMTKKEEVDEKVLKKQQAEAEKIAKKAADDLAKYEEELARIIRENTGTQIDQINAKYDAEIEALRKTFEANKEYSSDAVALEQQTNEAITALNEKRNKEIADANKAASDAEIQRKAEEYAKMTKEEALRNSTELMSMQINKASELELLRTEERHINDELARLKRENYETIEAYENAKTQLELEASQKRAEIIQEEANRAQTIMESASSVFGAINELISATSENEEEAAKRGKVLALAEIAFSTGIAIAEGVASAMTVPFPGNLVAIATTIATVIGNIATAISTVRGAKFADGGLVVGEGTGTSDSVPAMLSNGESVMTAKTTAMFAPVLSAFNQMGGGVPFTVANGNTSMGEELLARAFARGASMLPSPVVDVQEITRVADRVRVLENIANR